MRIPVECIVEFDLEGMPTPIRVRFQQQEENIVIQVTKILNRTKTIPGIAYNCESLQDGVAKQFQLQFDKQSCKWAMFLK